MSKSILLKTKSEELKIGSEDELQNISTELLNKELTLIRTLHSNAYSYDFTRNYMQSLCADVLTVIVHSIVPLSQNTSTSMTDLIVTSTNYNIPPVQSNRMLRSTINVPTAFGGMCQLSNHIAYKSHT